MNRRRRGGQRPFSKNTAIIEAAEKRPEVAMKNPMKPAASKLPGSDSAPTTERERSRLKDAAVANESLLIAGLHQQELTFAAEALSTRLQVEIEERKAAEAALQQAKDRLSNQALELEHLVAARTAELRETTRELEAFSYSVAHDMREPLRGMRGYAEILLAEHGAMLNPTGKAYLERIVQSASRMDMLIQDVLAYTKVLHADAMLTPIDLNRLTRDVIAIYPEWQEPLAEIEIVGVLPTVLGHEALLTQCITNLLSNAVKFMDPGVVPRIQIRGEAKPDARQRVWFENNGIGIAPKDRDRVFGMFVRLNSKTEFGGTGIGLTIVRRAIERMGGRIDFESEPGQGSRFWIELKEGSKP
ncbi:MAG: hypothetical protein JWM32_3239 [Verrucomicrobia bacterium]|nr:hypothetical protein [Verrucomicrobiota bacterium]